MHGTPASEAVELAFAVELMHNMSLVIDDVLTTGSTLSECARVLKRAGAISVHAATAARA